MLTAAIIVGLAVVGGVVAWRLTRPPPAQPAPTLSPDELILLHALRDSEIRSYVGDDPVAVADELEGRGFVREPPESEPPGTVLTRTTTLDPSSYVIDERVELRATDDDAAIETVRYRRITDAPVDEGYTELVFP